MNITDRSSRTVQAYYRDANKVMGGRDVRVLAPEVINKKCAELLSIIYKGGGEAQEATGQLIALVCPELVKVAKRFNNTKMGLVDLVQEASMSLFEELGKRDLRQEEKFTVFLFQFAKSRMTNAIYKKDNIIYIPMKDIQLIQKYETFCEDYWYENETESTIEAFLDYYEAQYGERIRRDFFAQVLNGYRRAKSVDEPIGEDTDTYCLGDTLDAGISIDDFNRFDEKESLAKTLKMHVENKRDFKLMYEYFELDGKFHTNFELQRKYGLKESKFNYIVRKYVAKLGEKRQRGN